MGLTSEHARFLFALLSIFQLLRISGSTILPFADITGRNDMCKHSDGVPLHDSADQQLARRAHSPENRYCAHCVLLRSAAHGANQRHSVGDSHQQLGANPHFRVQLQHYNREPRFGLFYSTRSSNFHQLHKQHHQPALKCLQLKPDHSGRVLWLHRQ